MIKQGRAWFGFVPAVFLVACCSARADLDSYVKQDDGAFDWKVEAKETTPDGTMSTMLQSGQIQTAEVAKPAKGNVAWFGDMEYEIDGVPYHLSTQVRQFSSRAAR